jgi:hypothetical protein
VLWAGRKGLLLSVVAPQPLEAERVLGIPCKLVNLLLNGDSGALSEKSSQGGSTGTQHDCGPWLRGAQTLGQWVSITQTSE